MNNKHYNVFIVYFAVFVAFAFGVFLGMHSNIRAERVHAAIAVCETNGGLEYIDWSQAGCNNGAEFNIFTYLDRRSEK